MRMAMIGLGKMGANMARRLCRGGIEVVGYNRSPEIVQKLAAEEGMIAAADVALFTLVETAEEAVAALQDFYHGSPPD